MKHIKLFKSQNMIQNIKEYFFDVTDDGGISLHFGNDAVVSSKSINLDFTGTPYLSTDDAFSIIEQINRMNSMGEFEVKVICVEYHDNGYIDRCFALPLSNDDEVELEDILYLAKINYENEMDYEGLAPFQLYCCVEGKVSK